MPAGSLFEALSRHTPTLSRIVRPFAKPVQQALRYSRAHRFAWPALVTAAIDGALRRPPLRTFTASRAFDYGGRVLLMALLWGALGGLLSMSLRARRPGSFVALPLATFVLLLLCLSTSHFAYFMVNGHFATTELLSSVWTLRAALLAYLVELPTVTGAMFAAITSGFAVFLAQANRDVDAPVENRRKGIWLCLVLLLSATFLVAVSTDDAASVALAPPDAGGLGLFARALRRPAGAEPELLRGAFRRLPLVVPKLERSGPASNVLVILTESVRADAMCSDPHECSDKYLDPPASDRIGLTHLRSQSPGTFSTCMVLWTGLEPDTEYPASHQAPLLWEVARAAGYRTLYVTAQSPDFLDFGKYLTVAGIDDLVTAIDLEPQPDVMLGAPDEKAMAAFITHVAHATEPWYGVLHLSNTHAMYRTDPDLQSEQPPSSSLEIGLLPGLKKRYLDAIALQRRSLGTFLQQLRALPAFRRTLVLFLSDHGEPLGDHGQLIHRDGLFEASMRVPGWALAGPDALRPEQREALASNSKRLLYTRDIHATVLDALGVWDERQRIPYADQRAGRSLLRPMPGTEPMVPFANLSGVWSFARPHYGVAQGERKLLAGPGGPFYCYDLSSDPREHYPQPADACGSEMSSYAQRRFPRVGKRGPPP